MKTVLFSFLSCTLLLYSCTKEHDTLPAHAVTPTAEKISGSYNLVGLSLIHESGQIEDLFTGEQVCLQDDIYHFRSNGSVLYTDAGLVCETTNTAPGSWELVDKRTMRLGTTTYRIQHFNGRQLSIVMDTVINGQKKTLNRKFMRR